MNHALARHMARANSGLVKRHKRRWTASEIAAGVFLLGAVSGLWYGPLVWILRLIFGPIIPTD